MKITVDTNRAIEMGGKAIEFKSYGVGNVAVMQQVMRSSMYSNPIKAAMQEYASNARDAHRELGNHDRPIEINFTINSEVEIRDYGIGISPERMEKNFASYFDSSKRANNDMTGGYGLGCKTAFADQDRDFFTVKSVYPKTEDDGSVTMMCHMTMHMISKHGETSWGEVAHYPTDEERGTTISLPIREEDTEKYLEAIVEVTKHWEVRPIVQANEEVVWPIDNIVHKDEEGDNWALAREGVCEAVVDGIPYPINQYLFSSDYYKILARPFRFYFKTGEVDIVATREALDYRSKTVIAIEQRLRDATDQIKASVQRVVDAQNDYWEARQQYFAMQAVIGEGEDLLIATSDRFGKFFRMIEIQYGTPGKLMVLDEPEANDGAGSWRRVSRFSLRDDRKAIVITTPSATMNPGRLASYVKEYSEEFELYIAVVPNKVKNKSGRTVITDLPMEHLSPENGKTMLKDWDIDERHKNSMVGIRRKAPRGTFYYWDQSSRTDRWRRTADDKDSPSFGLLHIVPDGRNPVEVSNPFYDLKAVRTNRLGTKWNARLSNYAYAIKAADASKLDLSGFTLKAEIELARKLKEEHRDMNAKFAPRIVGNDCWLAMPKPMQPFVRQRKAGDVRVGDAIHLKDYFPFMEAIRGESKATRYVLSRMPWHQKEVWRFVADCKKAIAKYKLDMAKEFKADIKKMAKALDDQYRLAGLPRTSKQFIANYRKRHSL